MSIDHYDPYIEPPYFLVAQNGKSHPEFVNSYRGSNNLRSRWKYYLADFKTPQKILTKLINRHN
jgi:hypothetical protein